MVPAVSSLLAQFSPWETRAWWWSRFKGPPQDRFSLVLPSFLLRHSDSGYITVDHVGCLTLDGAGILPIIFFRLCPVRLPNTFWVSSLVTSTPGAVKQRIYATHDSLYSPIFYRDTLTSRPFPPCPPLHPTKGHSDYRTSQPISPSERFRRDCLFTYSNLPLSPFLSFSLCKRRQILGHITPAKPSPCPCVRSVRFGERFEVLQSAHSSF